ncbi:unnamed protein product [marine sediment metagenome]|uniref:Uncharacterized protein n=1 Tax=marine sediment metagenome TaxID=412755 RepID=X1LHA3_9ZZZZ
MHVKLKTEHDKEAAKVKISCPESWEGYGILLPPTLDACFELFEASGSASWISPLRNL